MSSANESANQEPVIDEVVIEESSDNPNDRKGTIPAWLISVGSHVVAVAVMAAVVFSQAQEIIEYPPPTPMPPPTVQKEDPKEKPPAIDPTPLDIQVPETSNDPQPISQIEPLDAEQSTEDAKLDGSPGSDLAVSDVMMADTGAFMTIGAGNKSASMFSMRQGPGSTRAARQSTSCGVVRKDSVDMALQWFKRHQSENGMWDVDQYQNQCRDGTAKCEPGQNQAGEADVACTAYALMCFLGRGYDHVAPSKFRPTVEKALNWLLNQQKADGLFGERNYEHAVATMAIAEALGLSNDQQLRTPAQKAVNLIIARQAQDPDAKDKSYAGLAWDYVAPNAQRNDTSVSGWNMMALKSALGAGLQVGNSMQGAKNWVERAWKAANPDWKKLDPYQGESVFPYTYDATSDKVDKDHLACVGALCAIYLGHHKGDVMLETMANYIMKHDFPNTWPTNTYFLYYNTLAVFQMGDERWKQWDAPVAQLLADAQRKDDSCFNGSWDYVGTKFHGHDTGRLLSTAYACLSQEVIWRYTRLEEKNAKH